MPGSSAEQIPGDPPVGTKWANLRPTATRTVLGIAAIIALYLAFETGRYVAGYNVISAMHERARLTADLAHFKAANRALQARVVELQTLNAGHQREDEVVTRTLSDLQGQIARQAEKLAFYRGVVAQGTPPIGLRIGEVRLSSGKLPLHYRVNISLLRADRPDGNVSGTVELTVDGQGPDGTALSGQALTGSRSALTYQFRYYQELTEALVLPPGVRPAQLTVTVRSNRKDIAPLTQAYPWNAISGP